MTSMTDSTRTTRMTGVNITHLSLVSVPVADQHVAKSFYTEMLRFTVARELVEGGQQWVEPALNGTTPTITLVTWFPQMPAGSLQGLVFDTDNIAQVREELRARGVEISPIEGDPWGQYARFSDPDGNGLLRRQKAPTA